MWSTVRLLEFSLLIIIWWILAAYIIVQLKLLNKVFPFSFFLTGVANFLAGFILLAFTGVLGVGQNLKSKFDSSSDFDDEIGAGELDDDTIEHQGLASNSVDARSAAQRDDLTNDRSPSRSPKGSQGKFRGNKKSSDSNLSNSSTKESGSKKSCSYRLFHPPSLPITYLESFFLILLGICNGLEYAIYNYALTILPITARQFMTASGTVLQMIFASLWGLPPRITGRVLVCGMVLGGGGVLQGIGVREKVVVLRGHGGNVEHKGSTGSVEGEEDSGLFNRDSESSSSVTVGGMRSKRNSDSNSKIDGGPGGSGESDNNGDDKSQIPGSVLDSNNIQSLIQIRQRFLETEADDSNNNKSSESAAPSGNSQDKTQTVQQPDSSSSRNTTTSNSPTSSFSTASNSSSLNITKTKGINDPTSIQSQSHPDSTSEESSPSESHGLSPIGVFLQLIAMTLSCNKSCGMQYILQYAPNLRKLNKPAIASRTMTVAGFVALGISYLFEFSPPESVNSGDSENGASSGGGTKSGSLTDDIKLNLSESRNTHNNNHNNNNDDTNFLLPWFHHSPHAESGFFFKNIFSKTLLVAFSLSIMVSSELRILQFTSSVTLGILGLLHSIPIVLAGVILFGDRIGEWDVLSYVVCFFGSVWYAKLVRDAAILEKKERKERKKLGLSSLSSASEIGSHGERKRLSPKSAKNSGNGTVTVIGNGHGYSPDQIEIDMSCSSASGSSAENLGTKSVVQLQPVHYPVTSEKNSGTGTGTTNNNGTVSRNLNKGGFQRIGSTENSGSAT